MRETTPNRFRDHPPKDKTSDLIQLGASESPHQYDEPTQNILETFPNQYPHRDYEIEFIFNEFTSLCPKTGQPDFATISIKYVSDQLCIETKSLKLYFLSFRQHGAFMETIVNRILEDCFSACQPKWMHVSGEFNVRGGTLIKVDAKMEQG